MSRPPLQFRPHHFLCTLCFQGKGYSPTFTENYQQIVDQLNGPQGELTLITVAEQTDAICEPCPQRRGTKCENQAKIDRLDAAHAALLDLKPGDVLTWQAAKQRIAAQVTVEQFHHICTDDCRWKALGICEKVIKNGCSS